MRRLLSQTEQWLVIAGCILSLTLAAILWLIEPTTLNRSPEVIAIVAGLALLAIAAAYAARRHAQHHGQLRWLGIIWVAGLTFPLTLMIPWLIPDLSGATSAFFFDGYACLAAGVVGVVRELIPQPQM